VLPRGGTVQVRRLVDNNEAYDDEDDRIEDEWDGEDEDGDDGMNADDDVTMEDCADAALVDNGASTVISFPVHTNTLQAERSPRCFEASGKSCSTAAVLRASA
jgi:hypothetical protein